MVCPQCRHANALTAKFCNNCGTRLDLVCPACGHANAPASRFCAECGSVLDASARPAAAPAAYTPPHLATRILTSRAALEG